MKVLIITFLALMSLNLVGQPGSQTAFTNFVALYNQEQFEAIYNGLSDRFKAQVDAAVVTGGLRHVFETNGTIHSAIIERQSADEGSYVALAGQGALRILLSIDQAQQVDGLRIKIVPAPPPQPPALVFNEARFKSQ